MNLKLPVRFRWLVVVILALAALTLGVQALPAIATSAPTAAPLLAADSQTAISGSYIVVFKSGINSAGVNSLARAAEALGARINFVYAAALQGFAADMSSKTLDAVRTWPEVAYVEANQTVSLDAVSSWGLDRIDQRNLPLDNTYSNGHGNIGTGVHAYVIDTGINATHNDFAGRVAAGYDFVDNDNDPNDCHGHGTHVSGTVGGTTYGVARGVTLHAVRVLNCSGSGTTAGVVAGVNWVAANHLNPAVANMSLGGSASSSLDAAVAGAVNAGVAMAVAAGNDSQDACNYSPAREPLAITVGATDSNDVRAYFSNWGSCLDVFAPGVNITSAWIGGNNSSNTISGTSMASPHVAGVAALVRGLHPTWTPAQVATEIRNDATRNIVGDSACSDNILLYSQLLAAPGPIEKTDPCPGSGCVATYLLQDPKLFADSKTAGSALDTLYQLRDDVMVSSVAGQHYRDLYYAHTSRITYLMVLNPHLRSEGAAMLRAINPAVNELLNGGQTFQVTPQLLAQFGRFLNHVAQADRATAGGGALADVIMAEMNRVPWGALAGMNAANAWNVINASVK